jgi:uncharacterized sporulation protein YeaH/YhbH (DUF444 family)
LKRLDGALKAQVDKLVARHKLQDTDKAVEVTIERKNVSEPHFSLDPATGAAGRIIPGNDQYRVGDKIARNPAQGQGAGGGQGAGEGSADEEDSFRFVLSREEYLSLLFDELELPPLVKKDLLEIDENRFRRGGVVRYGNPGPSTAKLWRKPKQRWSSPRAPGWRPEYRWQNSSCRRLGSALRRSRSWTRWIFVIGISSRSKCRPRPP